MSRSSYVCLVAILSFAIVNTAFLVAHLATPQNVLYTTQGAVGINYLITATQPLQSPAQWTFQFFLANSPALSTVSWAFVGGVWIWRGRVRSRWENSGFDSGLFDLFMKMKGAKTRMNLLDSLSKPKDRFQLAQELGLDWKAVDYHIVLLNRYGLVHEDHAFGSVKMYQLTKQGEMLLQLLKDFNKGGEPGIGSPRVRMGASDPAAAPSSR